jgi:hypothetical protein
LKTGRIYQIAPKLALVQTVDFFTPLVLSSMIMPIKSVVIGTAGHIDHGKFVRRSRCSLVVYGRERTRTVVTLGELLKHRDQFRIELRLYGAQIQQNSEFADAADDRGIKSSQGK